MTTPSDFPIASPPSERAEVADAVRQLAALSLHVVPVCRPLGAGRCTAPWHAVPCTSAGKRPLQAGYRQLIHHPPSGQLLEAVLGAWPCNVALVVAHGHVVVEADSPEAEREVEHLSEGVTRLAPARERRPERGRAWLFTIPSPLRARDRAHLGESGAIDVRGPGGLLVLPPSRHASGHRYTWVSGQTPWELAPPPCPPALLALVRPEPPETAHEGPVLPAAQGGSTSGVSPRVQALLRSRRRLQELFNGEGKTHGDRSESGIDYTLAVELLRLGVPPREVEAALGARAAAHRHDTAYCAATVRAAMRGGAKR